MKALVTGGAGFVGSHLADRLLSQGIDVSVVDDLSTGKKENIPVGARFHRVDITDRASLCGIFAEEKPDVVCHYAAQASVARSVEDPAGDAEVNVVGGLTVLKESINVGVRRSVFASTGGAMYGNPEQLPVDERYPSTPLSPYGAAKLALEHYLELHARTEGLSFASLRYANIFGPRQDPLGEAGVVAIFIGRLLQGLRPTVFGDGTQTRDYVYVDDAVDAALKAISSSYQGIYNIGTGRQTSVLELVDGLGKALGTKIQPQFSPPRAGEVTHIALDSSKAQKELGWCSHTCLRDGLERVLRWQQYHDG